MATSTLGFEIEGIPPTFKKIELKNGVLDSLDDAEYINITDPFITPIKAIRLLGRVYVFNSEIQQMEEQDLIEEGIETIGSIVADYTRMQKNIYRRMFQFDCIREDNQANNSYQLATGLMAKSKIFTLKTHSFNNLKDSPQHEDILFYKGTWWLVDEVNVSYVYTPREKMVLHLTLKMFNKKDEL